MNERDFCPECGNTTLLNDDENGEIVCTTCGLVIGNTEFTPPTDRTPTKNTSTHTIAYTSSSLGTEIQSDQRTELNTAYDINRIIQKIDLPRSMEPLAINYLRKLRRAIKQHQNSPHYNKIRLTRTELAVVSVWTIIKQLNYPLTANEYVKKLQSFFRIQSLMRIEKRAAYFIRNENRIPDITLTTAHINKITANLETHHVFDSTYANRLGSYAVQILLVNPGIMTNRRANLVAASAILAADKLLAKRLPLKTLAQVANTGTANLSSLSETCKHYAPTVPPECAAIQFTENLFRGGLLMKLPLDQIRPNAWNCNFLGEPERKNLKQRMIQDGSEKTLPIVVREVSDGYEIVDGEHRWVIAKELCWTDIAVVVQEANDLESKSLCISYNRLRGRLNWFKLYDVVCGDLAAGVDLAEVYKGALSGEELKWLLSLGSFAPQARQILEDSLKKYPELSLEQLYLITLFPEWQQKGLIEKFKNSVIGHALIKALTPFLPVPNQSQQQQTPYTPKETNYLTQQTNKTVFPNKTYEGGSDFGSLADQGFNASSASSQSIKQSQSEFEQDLLAFSQEIALEGIDKDNQTPPYKKETPTTASANDGVEVVRALLVSVSYCCECGRSYYANFKNLRIVTQTNDVLFEHVDFQPCTFIVHCNKCNTDHEYTLDSSENDVVQILCNRCKPPRKGILNINTGEATWLNNNNNNADSSVEGY